MIMANQKAIEGATNEMKEVKTNLTKRIDNNDRAVKDIKNELIKNKEEMIKVKQEMITFNQDMYQVKEDIVKAKQNKPAN
mmetsp:Transcript_44634/g.37529  ORF Transcript_44634/g.37529 Transcript_44634/m.37529 type:complete len:80 (+) Transcript_44634:207-446(+)